MDKPRHTKSVSAGSRIYYIDAHKDGKGQSYITITEILKLKGRKERRQRIFIHIDNVDRFVDNIREVSNFAKCDTKE